MAYGNVELNEGVGGADVAVDAIGGSAFQLIKLAFGGEGVGTVVTGVVGLPVQLLASTEAIGKLAPNSGVIIGDVNVVSQVPGTGATNLGKGEDTPHASGDVGVMMLSVRSDTPTSTAGTTGDYCPPISDPQGRLYTAANLNSGSINAEGVACTPKFAVISAASSGENTVVAAVTNKKIRVLNYTLISAGTVNASFKDAAAGNAITGAMPLIANSGASPGFSPAGHFQTAASGALILNLSAAIGVYGHLTYIEV